MVLIVLDLGSYLERHELISLSTHVPPTFHLLGLSHHIHTQHTFIAYTYSYFFHSLDIAMPTQPREKKATQGGFRAIWLPCGSRSSLELSSCAPSHRLHRPGVHAVSVSWVRRPLSCSPLLAVVREFAAYPRVSRVSSCLHSKSKQSLALLSKVLGQHTTHPMQHTSYASWRAWETIYPSWAEHASQALNLSDSAGMLCWVASSRVAATAVAVESNAAGKCESQSCYFQVRRV